MTPTNRATYPSYGSREPHALVRDSAECPGSCAARANLTQVFSCVMHRRRRSA